MLAAAAGYAVVECPAGKLAGHFYALLDPRLALADGGGGTLGELVASMAGVATEGTRCSPKAAFAIANVQRDGGRIDRYQGAGTRLPERP